MFLCSTFAPTPGRREGGKLCKYKYFKSFFFRKIMAHVYFNRNTFQSRANGSMLLLCYPCQRESINAIYLTLCVLSFFWSKNFDFEKKKNEVLNLFRGKLGSFLNTPHRLDIYHLLCGACSHCIVYSAWNYFCRRVEWLCGFRWPVIGIQLSPERLSVGKQQTFSLELALIFHA